MKSINHKFLFFFSFVVFVFACTTSKKVHYFQDLNVAVPDTVLKKTDYLIRPNDILHITVTSLNPELDVPFSRSEFRPEDNTNYVSGYLVDSSGAVNLPYAGLIILARHSIYQAKKIITDRLSPYLKDPVVNIRLKNYSVSILGEVNKAGTYTFPSEIVTVTQALSMAGDLTIFAQRDSILIIREVDGLRTYKKFDLRKSDILHSPYYYLMPNDVIYVPPSTSKVAQSDTRRLQILVLISSVLSFTAIIVANVK